MSRRSTRNAIAAVSALPVAAFALATLGTAGPAGASTTTTKPPSSTGSTTATTGTSAPASKPTAAAEYSAALKAAHGRAVHFVSTATENGTTIHVIGDTGANSGVQTITVKRGSVVEHVKVVRVGPTGYVDANDAALRNVIGLTSAQSSEYAGRWMSFPASNTTLDALVAGLRNSDVSSELQMRGPYSYVSSTATGGQAAIAIHGTVPSESGQAVTQILYLPASGPPLPREDVTNPGLRKGSSAIHGSLVFSDWGEKKTVKAPAHAVSLLKVADGTTKGTTSTTSSKG